MLYDTNLLKKSHNLVCISNEQSIRLFIFVVTKHCEYKL